MLYQVVLDVHGTHNGLRGLSLCYAPNLLIVFIAVLSDDRTCNFQILGLHFSHYRCQDIARIRYILATAMSGGIR